MSDALWKFATGVETPRQAWARQQGRPWQCSGCGRVFREWTPRSRCECGREGYWTGSVPRKDVEEYDEREWQKAIAEAGLA